VSAIAVLGAWAVGLTAIAVPVARRIAS